MQVELIVESHSTNDQLQIPAVMQAVAYAKYGGPEVLEAYMLATPTVGDGDVLVEVHAAGINPIDYRIRSGEVKWLLPGGFPRIPGYDVAGVVVAERSSGRFAVGDRVLAFLDNKLGGAYAEYALCSEKCVAKMSSSMTFEEGAAIPLAGTTALQSLRDHGAIQRGDRVLINGGSGGVGAFAIQIAKAYNTEVTAVASTLNEVFCRSLGADAFIDHETTSFTQLDRTWDLIFDAAGKSSYLDARPVMSQGGRYVSTEPSISGLMVTAATQFMSKRGRVMLANPSAQDLRELIRLYESGDLKVTVSEVFRLNEACKAHELIESGVERGKIVLRF